MKPEVISAVAAAISALGALLAIYFQRKSQKDIEREKIEFAKGILYIIFCEHESNVFKFGIKNRGQYCITDFSVKWNGNYDAKINVKDLFWGDAPNKKKYDYEIILDFTEKSSFGHIKGVLSGSYKDVYGNTKEVSKEIEISSRIDDLEEKEYLNYDLIKSKDRLFR